MNKSVCVASIIRIITIHHLIKSIDLTWAMASVFIWSCCEPFIGIVCACLPTLAPFFRRWWSTVRTRNTSGTPNLGSGKNLSDHKSRDIEAKRSHTTSGTGIPEPFRLSKQKREWTRVKDKDTVLRNDDEIELTNNITGPGSTRTKASEEGRVYAEGDIVVKKDVSWSSTQLDDDSSEDTRR